MTTTGPGAVHTRPAWRRWLLAALPWVAGAVLAVGGLAARATDTASPAAPAPPGDATVPAAAASPAATPTAPPPPTSAAAPTGLPAELELAVLATARTALGTAGLPVEGPAPDRWPLELRVAEVRPLADGLAVVRVHGLVIERVDEAWQAPRGRAVAVPVRLGAAGAVLGPAWPVAAPSVPVATPDGRPVEDGGAATAAALQETGWTIEEVLAVELVAGQLLRVQARGVAPGDDLVADHTVWLRDDPGGPQPLLPRPSPTTSPTAPTQETP